MDEIHIGNDAVGYIYIPTNKLRLSGANDMPVM
jgi:hypothetical protein